MQELYNRGLENFKQCYPTIKFIRKINSLIDVMNSRTAHTSITSNKESHGQEVVIILTFHIKLIILLFLGNIRFSGILG